jgi:hypothetical protein
LRGKRHIPFSLQPRKDVSGDGGSMPWKNADPYGSGAQDLLRTVIVFVDF